MKLALGSLAARLAWKSLLFLGLPGLLLFSSVRCNPTSTVVGGQDQNPVNGSEIKAKSLVDAPYRVVWARDFENDGHDPFARKGGYKLMGFDSERNGGEIFELLGNLSSYRKPMFTADGSQVVFTDYPNNEMKIVNWNGSGLTSLGTGMAMELWTDPEDGTEYLYYLDCKPGVGVLDFGRPLVRAALNPPGKKEVIYDETDLTLDTFQLSADGKRAACLTPWPDASIMNLETRKINQVGTGCWVAMAPDNSYNMWVFDGAHKNLILRNPASRFPQKVYLSGAPGVDDAETYHPRWSNHPRIISMTGPYKNKGDAVNAIGGGGKIGVYVGRFNEDFTGIEAWLRLTSEETDQFPEVWVKGGEQAGVKEPVAVAKSQGDAVSTERWPSAETMDGVQYIWANSLSPNMNVIDVDGRPYFKCRNRLIDRARYGQFGQGIFLNGGLTGLQMEDRLADAVKKSGAFSLEMALFALPQKTYEENAVIAAQASSQDDGNFLLSQSVLYNRPQFQVKVRTGEASLKDVRAVELFNLPLKKVTHFAMTYEAGTLSVYLDGKPKEAISLPKGPKGKLNWKPHPLVFGALKNGDANWPGFVENIAVYAQALTPEQVAAHAKYYFGTLPAKKGSPEIRVKAKLLEMTAQRPPESLGAYRRDLVEYAYEIEEVLSGTLEEEQIKVLHWSILDRKPLPETKKVGETYTLRIAPAELRPELEGERVNGGQLSDPTLSAYLDLDEP